MRLRSVLLLATAALALVLPTNASAASTLGCVDDATGTQDLSSWVPEMLAATNAHRTGMGLVALQLDPVLTRASVWKSRDMGRRTYFSHDDLALPGETSRTPWERLTACGWTVGGSKAENIAAGQQSGQAFITAWINSPGHRANIENASMRYVGFGVARVTGSRYGTYATQMFASVPSGQVTPPPPPPATPATPTTTQLALDYEGPAKTVCPSEQAVSYRVQSVSGQVDATNSGTCVRVAPRTGVGGVTATVDYYARGDAGGTSPTVRMTVTVAAAPPPPPPPPPPPTPDTPTTTQLALDFDGAARLVCPASGASTSYRVSSVTGQVDATNSGTCVRVAPRAGVGGITASVDYYARHDLGGTSPTVRMTVTVAAAPPPPPPPVPAAPTTTRLDFAYMGATQTACPTAKDVSFAVDRVEGWVVAGITSGGCLRVSPVSGIGGVTAFVTYHAVHVLGQSSPATRMTVAVAAAPAPDPDPVPDPTPDPEPTPDPAPPTPPTPPAPPAPDPVTPTPVDPEPVRESTATDPHDVRGTRATITRYRCRGARAVRGWCWRAVLTGRLLDADRTPIAGSRVTASRITGARRIAAGGDRTDSTGAFFIRVELRPPARGTAAWLIRNARTWSVDAATSTPVTVRARGI